MRTHFVLMKTLVLWVAYSTHALTADAAMIESSRAIRGSAFLHHRHKETGIKKPPHQSDGEVRPNPEWELPNNSSGTIAPLIKWKDESDVPKIVQYMLCFVWITMMATIPLMLPVIDNRPVTKTQIVVGGLTLMVLFGGFYLFTNVILFQSVHFNEIRPLTVVECAYFMAQTVTTIGYGDIGPAKTRGQVFVGLYVIFALFVIAMVLEDFTEHMIKAVSKKRRRLHHHAALQTTGEDATIDCLIQSPKPSPRSLLTTLAIFAFFDVCFVLFFWLYPGENKTLFQAFYMSLITLGSVGFGFFTPVTEGGMVAASFLMVLGCSAFVGVIGEFTSFVYQLNEYERANKAQGKLDAMQTLKKVNKGEETVTAAQFLEFCLVQSKRVDAEEIADILTVFHNMKPQDGAVAMTTIQNATTPREMSVH